VCGHRISRLPRVVDVINVGMVGAGVMGSLHGRNFTSFGDRARVSRVFDSDLDKAEALARKLEAEPVGTVDEVLSSPEVNAVAISIPPRSHRETVERALAHGKHVFLEKPIAITLGDAAAIATMAHQSSALVMVGHVLRFWPGYPELRQLAVSGVYGEPVSVACVRNQPPPSATGWLADVRETGGIAPLVLIHDFDLMNWILGPAKSVQAIPLRGDGISASHVVVGVSYANGNGVVEGSVSMPVSHPFSTRLNVFCENASLHFGYDVEPKAADDDRDASQFTPASEPVITIYPNDGSAKKVIGVPGDNPFRPELEYFLDRVENDLPIENGTPDQALRALAVAVATNTSLTEHTRVAIDD